MTRRRGTAGAGEVLGRSPSTDPLGLLARLLPGDSWAPWRTCAKAIYGGLHTLRLSSEERDLILHCTGRQHVPSTPARAVWLIVSRRGGKTRFSGAIVTGLAVRDYSAVLAPGERGTIVIISADRKQSRTAYRYVLGFLQSTPALAALIERQTAESIDLTNGITIEVHTASYRTVRGYTVVAAICDEIAFWPTEDSANPDTEIINALRPAMATVPGALLLCLSTPYARRGELWRAYERHFGKDSDVLVWQAASRTMNPRIDRAIVDQAYADDAAVASAEYGAQFRQDIESYISPDLLASATERGITERAPIDAAVSYVGFVDPSGGSADSFTLAIAHSEAGAAVLDAIREARPPFNAEAVVSEFAALLGRYGVTTVTGDHYAGEWPGQAFNRHHVQYCISERTKSTIYTDVLPLLTSGRVRLLDAPRLLAQFSALERRTGRSGKDSIDHRPGAHDDVANAAAGALTLTGAGLGKATLPATFTTCWKAANSRTFSARSCFVVGAGGMHLPATSDPACAVCPGWAAVRAAHRAHLERTQDAIDIRSYAARFIQPPAWAARFEWAELREQCKENPTL